MTRQRKWQLAHYKSGLCQLCPEPVIEGSALFCGRHAERMRTFQRNRYRARHGIALDAPVVKGRPRQS
jgi:hypothetical protein